MVAVLSAILAISAVAAHRRYQSSADISLSRLTNVLSVVVAIAEVWQRVQRAARSYSTVGATAPPRVSTVYTVEYDEEDIENVFFPETNLSHVVV